MTNQRGQCGPVHPGQAANDFLVPVQPLRLIGYLYKGRIKERRIFSVIPEATAVNYIRVKSIL